jgi:hypothetical protein
METVESSDDVLVKTISKYFEEEENSDFLKGPQRNDKKTTRNKNF